MLKIKENSIWLVVSDIDGTLIDDAKKMPKINREYIKKITEQNVEFAICSGRMPLGVLNIVKDLIYDESLRYIIGANGSAIYDLKTKSYIHFAEFTLDETDSIRKAAVKCGGEYLLCAKDGETMYFSNLELYNKRKMSSFGGYVEGVKQTALVCEDDKIVGCKFSVMFNDSKKFEEFKNIFFKHKSIEIKQNSTLSCDIVPANNTKWTGTMFLAKWLSNIKKYDIRNENIIFFGDELNDLAAFQNGKYAIAVANANKKIKEMSYEVCPSNNEGGLGIYLKEHMI